MKQTIFETRQRGEELLREAISIWRQSDDNDKLEGLENDPVIRLMMTALAYQTNETVSDLEGMKTEVMEELAQLLTPYEVGHAMPATAVVETALQEGIAELPMDGGSVFTLAGTGFGFIPLMKTRLMNGRVASVVRLDGRRWRVRIETGAPVKSLEGLAFAVRPALPLGTASSAALFGDLNVSVGSVELPLVKPWDLSELPLTDSFGLDTMLYNRAQTYEAQTTPLDLFARQNVRLFIVGRHKPLPSAVVGGDTVDLTFEFSGIGDGFMFGKEHLSLNVMVLVNAEVRQATLSAQTPVVRVAGVSGQEPAGSQESGGNRQEAGGNGQFLHAVRPQEEQMYGNSLIEVRRVAGDRFNQGRLVRLLNALIARYHSDYFAFQGLQGLSGDKTMQALGEILTRMMEAARKGLQGQGPGVYLLLRDVGLLQRGEGSVDVSYLTTAGAAVNGSLNGESVFSVPPGLASAQTRQIAMPVMGSDEITEETALASMSRYYIATCDRIVTPADMKLFCYKELLTRYGIVRNMVKSLTVGRRQQMGHRGCGYEICVEIVLEDTPFVKRSFAEKAEQAALLMQKMIEVRSTNIYPVIVTVNVDGL